MGILAEFSEYPEKQNQEKNLMAKSFNVAVAGATGAVGVEMIKTLEKRNFPVKNLKLLASSRSAGKVMEFKGEKIVIEELKAEMIACGADAIYLGYTAFGARSEMSGSCAVRPESASSEMRTPGKIIPPS